MDDTDCPMPTDARGDPDDLDDLVRSRLRSMRVALGYSLDELAARANLSASTISRLETGKRAIGLDVLQVLARALNADVTALVARADNDDDVVIRPVATVADGMTAWPLTRPDDAHRMFAAKLRVDPVRGRRDRELHVHPGRDWFFVLSGRVVLTLGDRQIVVGAGEAAEFSTMTPHRFDAVDGPAELITILDRDGHRAHLAPTVR
jgi:transcriptional regulator with XRE-family HTH domain